MKIGLVAQPDDGVLPPNQNSIGLILYNTARLLGNDHDVTVAMSPRTGESESREWNFGVSEIETGIGDRIEDWAALHPTWARRLGIAKYVDQGQFYFRAVKNAWNDDAPEIAHIVNYWYWCRGLKTIGCSVALEMQCEWLAQMDRKAVERQLTSADAIIGVSDHISNQFVEAFPGYRGIVATAYNGVDVDVFKPLNQEERDRSRDEGTRTVLFVGRLSPEKGIHVLLRAFAAIAGEAPNARLEMIGPRTELPVELLSGLSTDPRVQELAQYYDGSVTSQYQAYLDDIVTDYGLKERVAFLGNLPHKDLLARYQNADILVNPSFSESFGISIVEGMASGIPVIGGRVGGMAETVLHEETGLLVEPGDEDDLASALLRILHDEQLARDMGVAGRHRAVHNFSWLARVRRLEEIYRGIVENRS